MSRGDDRAAAGDDFDLEIIELRADRAGQTGERAIAEKPDAPPRLPIVIAVVVLAALAGSVIAARSATQPSEPHDAFRPKPVGLRSFRSVSAPGCSAEC